MVYVIVVILMFIVAALKDSGQDSVSSVFRRQYQSLG